MYLKVTVRTKSGNVPIRPKNTQLYSLQLGFPGESCLPDPEQKVVTKWGQMEAAEIEPVPGEKGKGCLCGKRLI